MSHKIAGEAELAREVRVLLTRQKPFTGADINVAIGVFNTLAQKLLKLRKTKDGEFGKVRGTGEALANSLVLKLTIPLDTRYSQPNEDKFNNSWAEEMARQLGVYTGGYIALESAPVRNQVLIETTASAEDVQRVLGGFGQVING